MAETRPPLKLSDLKTAIATERARRQIVARLEPRLTESNQALKADLGKETDKAQRTTAAYRRVRDTLIPVTAERDALKEANEGLNTRVRELEKEVVLQTERADSAEAVAAAAEKQHLTDAERILELQTENAQLIRLLEESRNREARLLAENEASPKRAESTVAQRFQTRRENVYGTTSTPERPGLRGQAVLGTESRIATRTDYSLRGSESGIFRLVNSLFGRTGSLLGVENTGNSLLSTAEEPNEEAEVLTPERARQIGRAIELLSQNGIAAELARGITQTFGVQVEHSQNQRPVINQFLITGITNLTSTAERQYDRFLIDTPGFSQTLETIETRLTILLEQESNPLIQTVRDAFRNLRKSTLVSGIERLNTQLGYGADSAEPANIAGSEITVQSEQKFLRGLITTTNSEKQPVIDYLIELFKDNRDSSRNLVGATQQLTALLPFAQLQAEMREILRPEVPAISEDGTMLVKDALNFHRILLSAANEGKRVSDIAPDILASFRLREDAAWFNYTGIVSRDHLIAAIQNESPMSIEFKRDKLITILTGANGSGKTSAQETTAETLAYDTVVRANPNARVVRLSNQLRNIRISGPALHTNEMSTYQGEIKYVAEGLKVLKPGDTFFIDEVGRGTDSRDAIALSMGIITYCIENNINVVVASHYGNKLLDMAKKFGLGGQIRMMSVDPNTRQLVETETAAPSLGIEVFQQRAEAQHLLNSILDPLMANAKAIRESVLTGRTPELRDYENIPERNSWAAYHATIADRDSLKDMGWDLSSTTYDQSSRNIVLTKMLDLATAGFPDHHNWRYHFQQTAQKTIRTYESPNTYGQLIIDQLVTSASSDLRGLIEGSKACSDLFRDLYRGSPADSLDLEHRRKEFEGLRESNFRTVGGNVLHASMGRFLASFEDPAKRGVHFETIQALGQSFIGSNQPELARLGKHLQDVCNWTEATISRVFEDYRSTNRDGQTLHRAIRNETADALNLWFGNAGPSEQAQYANGIAAALGERAGTSPKEYFANIAERLKTEEGIRMYGQISRWLMSQNPPDRRVESITEAAKLRDVAELIRLIEANINHITEQRNLPLGINPNNFQTVVWEEFLRGDTQLLMELTSALTKSVKIDPGTFKIIDSIQVIQTEKALACLEAVAPHQTTFTAFADMAFYATMVNAIKTQGWSKAAYSDDGSFEINEALPLALLEHMGIQELKGMSYKIPADVEASMIAGINGGGKTQLLITAARAFVEAWVTGYTTGKNPVLPKAEFVACLVNAGESTEGRSSFQNEADRYIALLNRYVGLGCPRNGYIFVDEPFASTSSEDQNGLAGAIAHFFKSRGVKIVYTNHNHELYKTLRDLDINYSVAGFINDSTSPNRFTPVSYEPSRVDEIKSEGIKVAGDSPYGVPYQVINIAEFTRDILDKEQALARAA